MTVDRTRRQLLKLMALLPLFLHDQLRVVANDWGAVPDPSRPSILILIFDALAAQNTSLHGYHRQTTPNLSRFAQRALVYHAHYAPGNHTTPGVASLLTGTYPWAHRAYQMNGEVLRSYEGRNLFSAFGAGHYDRIAYTHNLRVASLLHQLSPHLDTLKRTRDLCLTDTGLSELLFARDFRVASSTEQLPAPLVSTVLRALLRGVLKRGHAEEYGDLFPRGLPNLDTIVFVLEHAIDWIMDQVSTASRPYLAYYHLLPPHDPYTTRREFVDMFDDGWKAPTRQPHFFSEGHEEASLLIKRREYDEYVAYADSEFGRLYDFMLEKRLLDHTIVVVTSDHGETFERGILGHTTPVMYEPLLRVPLLISRPGQRERRDIHVPTSGIDLLPTLLQASGHQVPAWCEGEVLPGFGGHQANGDRPIFSVEAKENSSRRPLTKGTVALVRGHHKLIHYFGYKGYDDEYELFNLEDDPEETVDLFSTQRSLASDLRVELLDKLHEVNESRLW